MTFSNGIGRVLLISLLILTWLFILAAGLSLLEEVGFITLSP